MATKKTETKKTEEIKAVKETAEKAVVKAAAKKPAEKKAAAKPDAKKAAAKPAAKAAAKKPAEKKTAAKPAAKKPAVKKTAAKKAVEVIIQSPMGGNITPVGASANITGMGILRREGYEVENKTFMKYSVPFTFHSVSPFFLK